MLKAPIKIEFFGHLCVRQGKRNISRFRTYKTGVLLAYLAFYGQHAHPREELIEMLWTECNPLLGRNSLSQSLSSLRHQLESPGVANGEILQADRYNVRLNPETYQTDIAAFEETLKIFQTAAKEVERAAAFSTLSNIYKGEFLPGFYEDWNLRERERLKDAFLQILLKRIEQFEAQGDILSAIEIARRAVAVDLLNEDTHLRLMRLYAAENNNVYALRQFGELSKILADELGVQPSLEARNLARDLRAETVNFIQPKSVLKKQLAIPSVNKILPSGILAMLAVETEKQKDKLQKIFLRFGGNSLSADSEICTAFFNRATDALNCAIELQRVFDKEKWAINSELLPKMALHLGETKGVEKEITRTAVSGMLEQTFKLLNSANNGQFLCSETAAVLLRQTLDPNVKLQDLGSYRLNGGEKTERIYQADYEGRILQNFPSLNVESGYEGNLPLQLSRFFGRESEIAKLREWLNPKNSERRLITITGPGGTGKTRLSLETARTLLDDYRNAVWFVPLAAINEPRLIPKAILEAMELSVSASLDPLKHLVSTFSREKSFLVLDNFEHFLTETSPTISDESIRIVQNLLTQIPNLHCLITSRRRLGIFGEREFFLEPLPIPLEDDTLEQVNLCESVQLFIDRAQSVRPSFQITKTNFDIIAEICRRLEGIPLALELAAAQIQIHTPSQILKSLSRRLDFLTDRRRQAELRHQQLRATVDWSFQMLAPEAQNFFAALSIFRGGGNLADVEAVCNEPLALDYLALLQDFSFLRINENSIADDMRFRLLETLREYGEEKISSTTRDFLRERHAQHFLNFAEQNSPLLKGEKQVIWLQRFEQEHQNFLSALDWCLESKDIESGLRMISALSPFWEIHSHVHLGREKLQKFWELAENEAVSDKTKAKALLSAGTLAVAASDFTAARLFHEEALKLFKEQNDIEGKAQALKDLGRTAFEQGDYTTAKPLLQEGLELWRDLKDDYGIAISLNTLGIIACEQGDYSDSIVCYEESLELRRKLGDWNGIASQLNNMGIVYRRQGNYEAARKAFAESLAIRREMDDRRRIAASLSNLGLVAENEQDYETARRLQEESLAIRRKVGDDWGVTVSLRILGIVARRQGEIDTAQDLFEQSLATCRRIGNKLGIAQTLTGLGDILLSKGELEKARTILQESLGLASELNNKQGLTDVLQIYSRFALIRGNSETSAKLFFAAQTLRQTIGAKLPPFEQKEIEDQIAQLQISLNTETFQKAQNIGSSMTIEEAIQQTSAI